MPCCGARARAVGVDALQATMVWAARAPVVGVAKHGRTSIDGAEIGFSLCLRDRSTVRRSSPSKCMPLQAHNHDTYTH